MKKVLFVATVVGHIRAFHLPILKWFQENGWETHVAAKTDSALVNNVEYCKVFHNIDFTRKPFTFNNILAYCQLKKVFEQYNFDIIHCHTPVGGAITRLAAKNVRIKGTKVIYTAHGFHFYKGAPILNWILYYPIEKILAKLTDVIIVTNQEDYILAKNSLKSCNNNIIWVKGGVGVDTSYFKRSNISSELLKKTLHTIGLSEDNSYFILAAEFIPRKRHIDAIKAMSCIEDRNVHLLLPGRGILLEEIKQKVRLYHLEDRVHFIGFRQDLPVLMTGAKANLLLSEQEGLPRSVMEGMALGVPTIGTNIRGTHDLLENGCGLLVPVGDIQSIVKAMESLINRQDIAETIIDNAKKRIERDYDISNVLKNYVNIYKNTI